MRDSPAPSTIATTAATTTLSRFLLSPAARSSHSKPSTSPRSLSDAARRLIAGPSRTGSLNDTVPEDFPDPSTRWIGPGARILETPPAGTRGGLFATTPSPSPSPGSTTYPSGVEAYSNRGDDIFINARDAERTKTRTRSSHRRLSKTNGHRDILPPFSDGVSSRSSHSKTKGHFQYTARALPVEEVDNMSERAINNAAPVVDKETGAEHLDETSSSEVGVVTRKSRVKRHCAKWWWLHLLIFIAVTVLVVCLIIFVAVPKIAQQRIDEAKLTIQGIQLSQTQSTNYTLSINSTIEADSSISATIDPFEGVMYLEDWAPQTPFARIQFPQTTSAAQTVVNVTQFTEILDMDAFTVFNTWFLVNETINVSVEGDTQLKVSGISKKYPVHFKKTVNMPALSNFNGTTVPSSRVELTPDDQGNNFFGNVTIPNRSFITFEIGNASFIDFLLGENVGTVYIDNMTLKPGDNHLTMRANISNSPVLDAIQKAPYCETGILPFQLQGLNVTNHGQYLSYYAESMAATNQSVSIDVGADLTELGLNISCSTS